MSRLYQNGNNNNYIKVQKETTYSKDYKSVYNSLCYILPGFCAVVCYANSLTGDFVHDDVMAIRNNGDVLQRTSLSQLFSNDFWGKLMSDNTSHKSYRPLCTLTFRFNHMLFGLSPVAFHATNILLHTLATILFTYVCKNVINFQQKSATLAGLLFAVHPIHTEAVSGIVGRADVLACIFFLLSFISYVHSIGPVWPGCTPYTRKPSLLVLSVLLAACAMLVKEHGLTALGMCVVYDGYIQFQVGSSNCISHSNGNGYHHVKRSDKPHHPFLKRIITICLSLIILAGFRIWMLGGQLPHFSAQDNPASFCPEFLTRIMTYLYLLVFNTWLLLFPSILSYDWQFNSIPLVESITDVRNLSTVLFIVSMVLYTIHCLFVTKDSSQRRQILGLCLIVIPFLPASNLFIRVGFVVAERILYIPSMGYCILVIHGYDSLSFKFRRKRLLDSAFFFLLLLLGFRTVIRNQVWLTRESLFRSGLETLPNNPKMHYNFANFLKDTAKFEEAIHHYRMTLSLYPDHASAHNNLGTLLDDDIVGAEKHYREAIRITPTHSNAHYNLGTLLHQKGYLEESLHMLQQAIELNPGYTQAQTYLASVLGELDAGSEAEHMYRAVIDNKPDDADSYNNLGAYLHKKDRLEEAEAMYKKSLSLRPDHVVVIINLARLAKSLNRFKEAEAYYLRAVEVRRDAITLDNLAVFYFNVGKPDQASVLFQEALQKYPDSLDVKMHYASTLASLYEPSTAEKLLKEVLEHRPESIEALKNLAIVYGLMKRHQEALVILDKAIKVIANRDGDKATLVGLYQDKGNHLKDSKEFKLAITTYEELEKLDPGQFQTHLNLGVLYHMEDNLEKAQHHYTAAQKIQPNDKLLLQNIEKLRKRQQQLKQMKGNRTER
ncbi:protein O-mannosyl-transferase TMTC1-like [Lineus longissimus]|uniref:protein O-mannosyl-transferase TMTC1-like n=1 Tax=Lineus longissimus TaxID=88925 RepID=UPI00315CF07E